tara:strand:+ start:4454 stop:4807 length:354 start_codon:yes stop_codon:yes gene_type:complete
LGSLACFYLLHAHSSVIAVAAVLLVAAIVIAVTYMLCEVVEKFLALTALLFTLVLLVLVECHRSVPTNSTLLLPVDDRTDTTRMAGRMHGLDGRTSAHSGSLFSPHWFPLNISIVVL